MIKKVCLFLMVAVLTACSGAQVKQATIDVIGVSASLKVFDQTLDLAVEAVSRNADMYTTDEWQKLTGVRDRLEGVRATLKSLFDQPKNIASVVVAIDQIRLIYMQARQAYVDARTLIEPRYAELPPEDQQLLNNLDTHAKRIDAKLSRLTMMPSGANQTATVVDLITVVTMVAQALQ